MKNPGVQRTGFEPTTVALQKLHTDTPTIRPRRRRSKLNRYIHYIGSFMSILTMYFLVHTLLMFV